MKLLLLPESPAELAGLATNLVPLPLAHTHLFSFFARLVYDATEAGIFEALADQPATATEIAKACGLNEQACATALGVLVSAGYLRFRDGRYVLARRMRKWLLAAGPDSVRDQLIFMRSVWSWIESMPAWLRTGKGLDYHATFGPEQWSLYQRGMEAVARGSAAEVARKTPVPTGATTMLDIGGAHGVYSVTLCRRHAGLSATILELPAAVEQARPLLARHGMGERVRYAAGNALDWDMGDARYDLVLVSSLMHHLGREENRRLARRIAIALKPGGYFAIQEFIRPEPGKTAEIVGSILNLFFALSSTAGTWSERELAGWQAEAGLEPYRTIRFATMPGFRQIVARRR